MISTYIKSNTEYSNTLPLYLYELVSQPQYLPLKYEICKSFPHSLLKELSIASQIQNDPYHCIGKWNVMEFDVNKEFIIQLILRVYIYIIVFLSFLTLFLIFYLLYLYSI